MDRVQTIYTVKLSYYMISASIGTSSRSLRGQTVMLDTGSGYKTIHGSVLLLEFQLYICPGYKMTSLWDANEILRQILSAAFKHIRFDSTVCKFFVGLLHISAREYSLALDL